MDKQFPTFWLKLVPLKCWELYTHLSHISEDSSNTAGKPQNIRGSNVLVKPATFIFHTVSHPDNCRNICHHTNLKAQTWATQELLFMEQAHRLLQSSNVQLTNHLSIGFSMSLLKVHKLEGRNRIWVFTTLFGAKSPAGQIICYSSHRNWSKQYSVVATQDKHK